MAKGKRITTGVFVDGDGKGVVVHGRNCAQRVNQTLNIAAGLYPAPHDLAAPLLEDSQKAIALLADGDDLTAVKQKLAGMSITNDAIAHKLFDLGLLMCKQGQTMQMGLETIETGLKVQGESRKALKVLAELKRPPKQTTFVKNQQNALLVAGEADRSDDSSDSKVRAIEGSQNGRMDSRTQTTCTGTDEARQTVDIDVWPGYR